MERENWSSRTSFILACIGYAVGLGNIWRFPYLSYKSGGGAFLIPYVIMLVVCGLPLLFMELAVGQYTRRGPIHALEKMAPFFKGAGVATVIISFWLCTYYNVIISWAMAYLLSSFQSPLPWVGCQNSWNSERCWAVSENTSSSNLHSNDSISSTQEFYNHRILNMSDGIETMGDIQWELFGFLCLAWIIVYFCLWKSVKTTGKVVYVTATVPYLLLGMFLVRGVTLPGATIGLEYLFYPKWDKMLEAQVWVNAAAQVFNSIGIAFGSLIAFASYNKFHGPILRDTLIVVIVDAVTCIICGICVFSTLGNLAYELDKDIDSVVSSGPGLVFIVFPHALSKLPLPQVWSVIFFTMLILLGIDSQFATVEVIVSSLKDGYGAFINKYLKRHEVLVAIVCLVAFLFGIPYVLEGGVYYFQIVDYYAAAISLMYIAFFECIAIVWVYGSKRLARNIQDMTGVMPSPFYVICWTFLSPLLILTIWIFSWINYQNPSYDNGEYNYPIWAIALGWCIAATSLLPIPAFGLWSIVTAPALGLKQRLKHSLRSTVTICPCGCETKLDSHFQAHCQAEYLKSEGKDQLNFVNL